jgi:uncharacterized protein YdeI (YjbR/CyaY-like superfamily)
MRDEADAMIADNRFEHVEIADIGDLHSWLAQRHASSESVWLVRWKKDTPDKYVSRLDVLDELICWGWIDGIARQLDVTRTMQLISPRKQQAWAQSYKDRAARLAANGRMQEPGRAAMVRSKSLGLWDESSDIDRLIIPDDLRAELSSNPDADQYFSSTAPSYRRNVLRWLAAAKRPETRNKRIAMIMAASAEREKLPQM